MFWISSEPQETKSSKFKASRKKRSLNSIFQLNSINSTQLFCKTLTTQSESTTQDSTRISNQRQTELEVAKTLTSLEVSEIVYYFSSFCWVWFCAARALISCQQKFVSHSEIFSCTSVTLGCINSSSFATKTFTSKTKCRRFWNVVTFMAEGATHFVGHSVGPISSCVLREILNFSSSSWLRYRADRENPPASECLGVFGLSQSTGEKELRAHFEEFGAIDKVTLIVDRGSGISKGYAFVYFNETEGSTSAREKASTELDGRNIRIDYALPQTSGSRW